MEIWIIIGIYIVVASTVYGAGMELSARGIISTDRPDLLFSAVLWPVVLHVSVAAALVFITIAPLVFGAGALTGFVLDRLEDEPEPDLELKDPLTREIEEAVAESVGDR